MAGNGSGWLGALTADRKADLTAASRTAEGYELPRWPAIRIDGGGGLTAASTFRSDARVGKFDGRQLALNSRTGVVHGLLRQLAEGARYGEG